MNLSTPEINLFINSYEQNQFGNIVRNNRIPVYVEFLKRIRYYRDNNITIFDDVYASMKKQYQLTNDDLTQINILVGKLMQNKSLFRTTPSQIAQAYHDTTYSTISPFKEEDDYSKYSGKFELLDQVSDAMDKYQRRMKKSMARKLDWKKQENERTLQNDIDGRAYAVEDRYHSGEYEGRPNVNYDYYTNPVGAMMYPNQPNTITQNIENLYNELNGTSSPPTDFDILTQANKPNIYTKKEDATTTNLPANRFMDDAIRINNGLTTKIKNPINRQLPEHGYQYLKTNPNRVMDDRLVGDASRMENRTYVRR
jgi:hypothetical protein